MWTYNALKNGLLSDPVQEMNLNLIQAKTALAQMNVKWKSAGEKLNLKSENKGYDWSFDLLLIYWFDIDLILIWYWSWYWSILIGNICFFFQSLILKNIYSWYWKKNIFNNIDQDWSGLIFFNIGSSGSSSGCRILLPARCWWVCQPGKTRWRNEPTDSLESVRASNGLELDDIDWVLVDKGLGRWVFTKNRNQWWERCRFQRSLKADSTTW